MCQPGSGGVASGWQRKVQNPQRGSGLPQWGPQNLKSRQPWGKGYVGSGPHRRPLPHLRSAGQDTWDMVLGLTAGQAPPSGQWWVVVKPQGSNFESADD